jgi:hypothetical protein
LGRRESRDHWNEATAGRRDLGRDAGNISSALVVIELIIGDGVASGFFNHLLFAAVWLSPGVAFDFALSLGFVFIGFADHNHLSGGTGEVSAPYFAPHVWAA